MWDYLFSGWLAEREKLQSFTLRATGAETRYKRVAPKSGSWELDDPQGTVQIDLRVVADLAAKKKRAQIHWGEGAQSKGTWIGLPDRTVEWIAKDSALVDISNPTDRRQEFALDFDPRVLGLAGTEDIRYVWKSNPFDQILHHFQKVLKVKQVAELGGGRYEVLLSSDAPPPQVGRLHTLVINETKGFTVETHRYSNGAKKETPIDCDLLVSWEEREAVWVPVAMDETRRSGLRKVNLKIDWQSVNKPVPEQEFAIESIGAAAGTTVVDSRMGRDNKFVAGKIGQSEPTSDALRSPVGLFRRKTIAVVLVNIVLFAAIVILCIYRAKKRDFSHG